MVSTGPCLDVMSSWVQQEGMDYLLNHSTILLLGIPTYNYSYSYGTPTTGPSNSKQQLALSQFQKYCIVKLPLLHTNCRVIANKSMSVSNPVLLAGKQE